MNASLHDQPGSGNAWVDAMQQGDAEARQQGDDPAILERATAAAGRLFGRMSPEARAERNAQREWERSQSKRLRPRNDKPRITASDKLRLRATIGNVIFDETEVYAWFTVGTVSHGFRAIQDIEHAISGDATAFAKLEGRRLHLRSTTRPYSVAQWAKDTYDDSQRAAPGGPDLSAFLRRSQEHMQALSFNEKWVHLGVRVSTFRRYPDDPFRELSAVARDVAEVTDALQASPLNATPATQEDIEWLLRRSVCLGVPVRKVGAVADYDREDIPALSAEANWTGDPMTRHITVVATPPGSADPITRKVSILTLGRLSDQAIPQQEQTGWMQRTDRCTFPVEWSAIIDVIPERTTQNWLRGRLDIIADQMKHYNEEHGMKAPASLARQDAMASDVQEQLDSDHGGLAIRTQGWYRVAVSAPDEATLRQRVTELKGVYGARAELVADPNQYHQAREFIPGEKLSTGAHKRRMSVATLSAAIPQGTADVGDRVGVTLGYTAGSAKRAVAWHTHWDMERRARSGLCVIAAGLGGGKSFVLGSIVYQGVMMGQQWSVLDPSDRLGRLCDLPELRGRARYINLMRGREGELNPYRVVADPKREHHDSDEEWQIAMADAEGVRMSLMTDVLYGFLRPATRDRHETDTVLTRALAAVPPTRTASPTEVMQHLARIAEGKAESDLDSAERITAKNLLITYERIARGPIGKLIFPPPGAAPLTDDEDDRTLLTVYTLNGMNIPDAQSIASGNVGERDRLSLSIMTLAAWLVQSRIYQGDAHRRKGIAIDEGRQITSIDAGKTLITKTATDTRKFNLRALLSSQNVTHFDIDGDSESSLGNLVGAALIGSTEGDAEAVAALKVLRAPTGQGYEAILKSLRPPKNRREEVERDVDGNLSPTSKGDEKPRQFIFSDGRNVERIVIDLEAHPDVKAALDSNPRSYADAPDPFAGTELESEAAA